MTTKIVMLGLLFSLAVAAQNINYTYDASGRLALADYGNGTQIQYAYDNSGNLLSRTVVTPSASSPAADRPGKKNPPQEKRSAPPTDAARPKSSDARRD